MYGGFFFPRLVSEKSTETRKTDQKEKTICLSSYHLCGCWSLGLSQCWPCCGGFSSVADVSRGFFQRYWCIRLGSQTLCKTIRKGLQHSDLFLQWF